MVNEVGFKVNLIARGSLENKPSESHKTLPSFIFTKTKDVLKLAKVKSKERAKQWSHAFRLIKVIS